MIFLLLVFSILHPTFYVGFGNLRFGILLTFVMYLNTLFNSSNIQHVSHILQILWQNYGYSIVLEMAKAI